MATAATLVGILVAVSALTTAQGDGNIGSGARSLLAIGVLPLVATLGIGAVALQKEPLGLGIGPDSLRALRESRPMDEEGVQALIGTYELAIARNTGVLRRATRFLNLALRMFVAGTAIAALGAIALLAGRFTGGV